MVAVSVDRRRHRWHSVAARPCTLAAQVRGPSVDMCIDMCTDMSFRIGIDMCTDMGIHMCLFVCRCAHEYRTVYGHVCRHVCRHLCAHALKPEDQDLAKEKQSGTADAGIQRQPYKGIGTYKHKDTTEIWCRRRATQSWLQRWLCPAAAIGYRFTWTGSKSETMP